MTALTEHLKRIDPVGDLEDYENGGGDEPLHALVRQRRVDVELTVKKNLELVNYRIDDEGGVAAVVAGKDKLDQVGRGLLPLTIHHVSRLTIRHQL